jgi:hypothetical protein
MDVNKILNSDLLDIIFDGKNKEYGAYELRKGYSNRLIKALIFTGSLLLLIFVGTVLANVIENNNSSEKIDVSRWYHISGQTSSKEIGSIYFCIKKLKFILLDSNNLRTKQNKQFIL